MPSIIDCLPAWARASTTGQGLAGLVATGAAIVASHYTANEQIVGMAGVVAAAVVLILFPQAAGAPPAASVLAADIRPMILAYTAGLNHGAAVAQQQQPSGIVPVPSTIKKDLDQ